MSTRCQIAFYESEPKDLNNFEALIYRHSDGYPEGVMPDIEPFLKWWSKGRGLDDIEYVSARLLQYLCNRYDMHGYEYDKKDKDFTGTLGHGICKDFHQDIEYLYVIYPNQLEVYDIGKECFNENHDLVDINKAKKIGSIKLK